MSYLVPQGGATGTGTINFVAPSTNNNQTQTLPDGSGTIVVAGVNSALISGTAQNSTSGTSITFTGIPSWAKRITVIFNGVSTTGTSQNLIQIGSGSATTTGYVSTCSVTNTGATSTTSATTGFVIWNGNAAETRTILMTIANISGNTWISSHVGSSANGATSYSIAGGGSVSLAGALDRIILTTANGTDTFDAGSINILYE